MSAGHLAVAVAAILAFVANLALLRSSDGATDVVVAARPIQAGEVVGAGDFTTARLEADAEIVASLVTTTDGLDGLVAGRSLLSGEMVGASDLLTEAAPGGLASMALPIEPSHAVGGSLRVGDRVDIVDVTDGVAGYVVRDVRVLVVSDGDAGALAGVSSGRHIVVGLEEGDVLAVAEAIADGSVDVVVTTGADRG